MARKDSSQSRGVGHRTVWLVLAVLILGVLYVITSPQNRSEAEDAYTFASAVEVGEFGDLLSPGHLAYLPFVDLIYEPLEAVGLVDRSLDVMVVIGAFTAATAVVLFYVLAKTWLETSRPLALFGAAALATSYGFWRYGAEAEAYALASLLGLLLLLAAVKLKPTTTGSVLVGLAAAGAVLGHILNIALVLALPYLLARRGWQWRRLASAGILAAIVLALVTYGAFAVEVAQNTSPEAVEDGFLAYYLGAGAGEAPSLIDIPGSLAVLGSTVIASNFIYLYEPARRLVAEAFPGRSLADEFAMGVGSPDWLRIAAPLTLVGFLVAMILLIRHASWRSSLRGVEGRFLLAWLAVYTVIVIAGGDMTAPEVWLLALIPLWLLVLVVLRASDVRRGLLAMTVGLLALHSLVAGFGPLYLGEDRAAAATTWLEENAASSDLVITADSAALARYMAYTLDAQVAQVGIGNDPLGDIDALTALLVDAADTEAIAETMEERRMTRGLRRGDPATGILYVTGDVFEPPRWLRNTNAEAARRLESLADQVEARFEVVEEGSVTIYKRS